MARQSDAGKHNVKHHGTILARLQEVGNCVSHQFRNGLAPRVQAIHADYMGANGKADRLVSYGFMPHRTHGTLKPVARKQHFVTDCFKAYLIFRFMPVDPQAALGEAEGF